jgi:dTMP kinase
VFITLEGPEGAGKSTLAQALVERLTAAGRRPLLTFEPGGTPLGQAVREVVFHGVAAAGGERSTFITPRAEALLFCASRAQLVDTVILPHLATGGVVICDRYADSTLAYQCFGRGLPIEPVRATLAFAKAGLTPDLTVLLDLDVREGLRRKRAGDGDERIDRFESQAVEFHHRIRRGYLTLAAEQPDRWLVVDGSLAPDEVAARVWLEIERRLADRP